MTVKSCNPLLYVLLVHVIIYLKSVLRYKYLILDAYHLDTQRLRDQGCEDPWLIFEAKKGSTSKNV